MIQNGKSYTSYCIGVSIGAFTHGILDGHVNVLVVGVLATPPLIDKSIIWVKEKIAK